MASPLFIVLSAATAFFFLPTVAVQTAPRSPVLEELRTVYTRYSRYLDTQWKDNGWNYNVPSQHYQEIDRTSYNNLRMQATLASFYRFRSDATAETKVRRALENAILELPASQSNSVMISGTRTSTRSFHDMIGLYLVLRVLEHHPGILPPDKKSKALENIKTIFPWALYGKDTENRAFLGAAYATAILGNPLLAFTPREQKNYTELIRQKITVGLQSVDDQFLYHEGTEQQFSLHYHIVSADMLWYVGKTLGEPGYLDIAARMIQNVHKQYRKGSLHTKVAERPSGVGLQLVLLRTIGEKIIGSKNWEQYWQEEKIGRGFVDPDAPNRLVWQDTADSTFNDDYSLANMAELFWPMLNE